jgi:low temperature requirement protein LtrA
MRLRAAKGAEAARRVTWLELFFDLIFVAAVAQVAEPLHGRYTFAELVRLAPLLTLIWWAWAGHAFFSTRFDSDDLVQRALTLVQMFVVAVMAANAQDALDSRSSAGFVAAYGVLRVLLVAQYARARRVPEARALATKYLAGHGAAAALWLTSAIVPTPVRYWLWIVAFVMDLGTPWIAVRHTVDVPHNASHLPERFGLFTLILLGEAVVAVMKGIESHEDWPPAAVASAFLGMSVMFMFWWWYFDGAEGAAEQPVHTRREAVRFHIWCYAHFPLYLGIVVGGVGVNRIVSAAAHERLARSDVLIVTGATAMAMAAMTLVGAMSAGRERRTAGLAHAALALATLGSGLAPATSSPLALIVALSGFCLSQLVLSIRPLGQGALSEQRKAMLRAGPRASETS